MAVNTPKEVLALAEASAANKLQMPAGRVLVSAFLAGAYLAMDSLFSMLLGFSFPETSAIAPGLQRLLAGISFLLGLMLVVFAGAESFPEITPCWLPVR